MRKLKLFLSCLLMSILSIGQMWGADPDESITFSEQGYSNQQAVTSVSGTYCTITFDKGTNSQNAPKYFTTGSAIRAPSRTCSKRGARSPRRAWAQRSAGRVPGFSRSRARGGWRRCRRGERACVRWPCGRGWRRGSRCPPGSPAPRRRRSAPG